MRGEEPHLLVAQTAASFDEVRAPGQGSGEGLGPAPAGDAGVVAGAEHLGHEPPPEVRRPGVLRILEEPVGEALLGR